jgi:hypothetical protein
VYIYCIQHILKYAYIIEWLKLSKVTYALLHELFVCVSMFVMIIFKTLFSAILCYVIELMNYSFWFWGFFVLLCFDFWWD